MMTNVLRRQLRGFGPFKVFAAYLMVGASTFAAGVDDEFPPIDKGLLFGVSGAGNDLVAFQSAGSVLDVFLVDRLFIPVIDENNNSGVNPSDPEFWPWIVEEWSAGSGGLHGQIEVLQSFGDDYRNTFTGSDPETGDYGALERIRRTAYGYFRECLDETCELLGPDQLIVFGITTDLLSMNAVAEPSEQIYIELYAFGWQLEIDLMSEPPQSIEAAALDLAQSMANRPEEEGGGGPFPRLATDNENQPVAMDKMTHQRTYRDSSSDFQQRVAFAMSPSQKGKECATTVSRCKEDAQDSYSDQMDRCDDVARDDVHAVWTCLALAALGPVGSGAAVGCVIAGGGNARDKWDGCRSRAGRRLNKSRTRCSEDYSACCRQEGTLCIAS